MSLYRFYHNQPDNVIDYDLNITDIKNVVTIKEFDTSGNETWSEILDQFHEFLSSIGFAFPHGSGFVLQEQTQDSHRMVVMSDVNDPDVDILDNVFDADGNLTDDTAGEYEDGELSPEIDDGEREPNERNSIDAAKARLHEALDYMNWTNLAHLGGERS